MLLLHVKRKSQALSENIEPLARSWYLENKLYPDKKYAVSITAESVSQLEDLISDAKDAVLSDTPHKIKRTWPYSFLFKPPGSVR